MAPALVGYVQAGYVKPRKDSTHSSYVLWISVERSSALLAIEIPGNWARRLKIAASARV